MIKSNKINFIILILLLLAITLACNLFNKSTVTKESETFSDGEVSRSTDADSEHNDIFIDMTDDDIESTDEDEFKPVKSNNRTQTTVKFAKGKTSRGYKNAVVRGEKSTYTLDAGKGQNMSVKITSLEDNASFYILSPSKTFVGDGLEEDGIKRFNGTLTETGKYKVVVSPIRGNATYKITFAVSAKKSSQPEERNGGGTRVVKFRKGKSSASYSGAVIRGERDKYILGAKGGQLMSVSISSLEANAVFDIISTRGRTLASGNTNWSGQLSEDGKYKIVVGGTRGNATYKINFAIR